MSVHSRISSIFVVIAMVFLGRWYILFVCGFTPVPWNGFQSAQDERTLGAGTTLSHQILERFRQNMLTAEEVGQVRDLVNDLGAEDFRRRDKAFQELHYWRPGAEVLLKRRADDGSLERRRRTQILLQNGMGRWSAIQAEAAVRLARRSPSTEATHVLLDYLAFADDPGVELEIAATLQSFAKDDVTLASLIRDAAKIANPDEKKWLSLCLDTKEDEISPTIKSLALARKFFALIGQGDTAGLADVTQLPFTVGNGLLLNSTKDRDDFFKQAVVNFRETSRNASVTFLHVTRGEEYLRFADPGESEFASTIPNHELRAVHVRVRREAGQEEVGAVLVRVSPGGCRVIGLGQTGLRQVRGK